MKDFLLRWAQTCFGQRKSFLIKKKSFDWSLSHTSTLPFSRSLSPFSLCRSAAIFLFCCVYFLRVCSDAFFYTWRWKLCNLPAIVSLFLPSLSPSLSVFGQNELKFNSLLPILFCCFLRILLLLLLLLALTLASGLRVWRSVKKVLRLCLPLTFFGIGFLLAIAIESKSCEHFNAVMFLL